MKKILFMTLALILMLSAFSVSAAEDIGVWLNGEKLEFDVNPIIINGRTLVPLRVISECMGADVSWEQSTGKVNISYSGERYLDWNDYYDYCGDINDEGTAEGFGVLYRKDNAECVFMGYFSDDFIVEGRVENDNGYYTGGFSKEKFGQYYGYGTEYYDDGSYMWGFWENDVINGEFEFFDSKNNSITTGSALNGYWHGEIVTKDLYSGESFVGYYENGNKVTVQVPAQNNTSVPSDLGFPWYLYSNDGRTYLGKLSTNQYDSESISNKYGTYGSKYSSESIFNEYGTYGSAYSSESAFNKYALNPPKIVDKNGNFVAYLSSNEYKANSITYAELISWLKKYNQ